MSDRIVDEAYKRVRSRFPDEAWFSLPPRALTEEIYKEIRRIDAEREQAALRHMTGESPRNAFAA